MKIARTLISILILLFLGSSILVAAENPRITVLSYNIHHGEGIDGKLDLERIAGVIKSVTPDLVGLQEVDVKTERAGGVDQAQALGDLTGLSPFFAAAIPYQGGEYGIAVLINPSRFEEEGAFMKKLPLMEEREQRVIIERIVKFKDSAQRIRFYDTHLDHLGDELNRLPSAIVINQWCMQDNTRWKGSEKIEVDTRLPSILLGDMNATPESKTILELEKIWIRAGADRAMPSWPSENPRIHIDHIFFRPADRWKVIEIEVMDEEIASDHRPVMAVLELLPENPRARGFTGFPECY